MKISPSVEEVLQEIRDDNLSGATQLTQRGAKLLLEYLRSGDEEDLSVGIRYLARDLVAAQPAMAPMVNLANHLFQVIEVVEDPLEIRSKGIAAVEEFLDRLSKGTGRIRDHVLPLLEGKKLVMTHSYSCTVVEVLGHARGIEVICPEGRPLGEGMRTAQELGERGLRVRVMVDCAAPSRVRGCDLVMVGADSITLQGVVNKIGTYGLALAAHAAGVPFYVLSGREKFLPLPFSETVRIEGKDPGEVTRKEIPNMVVENVYFDITPLHLISAVVTPEGVIAGEQVQEVIETIAVSEGLKGI